MSYHHGDLRQSLLTTATGMIRAQGVAALSMRRLAEQVGVSHSAAYHHFRDKHALLCALAEQGFAQQDQMLAQLPEAGSLVTRFTELVLCYIRFAQQNPEQYDLMYGPAIWKMGEPTPDLQAAAHASFKCWLGEVGRLQTGGIMPVDLPSLRLAQVTWATLHGLCRLLIDGVYVDSGDVEAMGLTAVRLLLRQDAASA